jgi:hypothetical protein
VVLDPLRLYQERDARDRGTSRGLLIPTEEQYRERLSIAAGLNEEVRPVSVLDLGCGYADLADQLPADLAYVGVEMTPWIYQEAPAPSRPDVVSSADREPARRGRVRRRGLARGPGDHLAQLLARAGAGPFSANTCSVAGRRRRSSIAARRALPRPERW